MEMIPTLIIMIILIVAWVLIMKKMGGGGLGGKEMSFGKAKIKNTNDEKRKTTFDDVAGADEERKSLQRLLSSSRLLKSITNSAQEYQRAFSL